MVYPRGSWRHARREVAAVELELLPVVCGGAATARGAPVVGTGGKRHQSSGSFSNKACRHS
jgi:hypothetical protein